MGWLLLLGEPDHLHFRCFYLDQQPHCCRNTGYFKKDRKGKGAGEHLAWDLLPKCLQNTHTKVVPNPDPRPTQASCLLFHEQHHLWGRTPSQAPLSTRTKQQNLLPRKRSGLVFNLTHTERQFPHPNATNRNTPRFHSNSPTMLNT